MKVSIGRRFGMLAVVSSLGLLLFGQVPASAVTTRTRLVSVATDGTRADNNGFNIAISGTGRYIALESAATTLVPQTTHESEDVFLRDIVSRTTELISVNTDEEPADDQSNDPSISADGRYVAFTSWASNFDPNDDNGRPDIYVRDRELGTTTIVSVSTNGTYSDTYSYDPHISANGRFVVFTTESGLLVPNDTPEFRDVVIRDLVNHTTRLVSVSSSEVHGDGDSQDSSISADGNLVAFWSGATNLVNGGTSNGIYVRNRRAGTTQLVSVNSREVPANGSLDDAMISANGRFVVFHSGATNLARGAGANTNDDVFIRDRKLGTTAMLSRNSAEVPGDAASYNPSISANGRFVSFTSDSTNLVPNDGNGFQEVFLRDRTLGTTRRVSVKSSGGAGDDRSTDSQISGDGRFVAFVSPATNLIAAGDDNGFEDVYVRGPLF